jgi:hypothetical protein
MGTLTHGPLELEIDDRILTHLEIVIVNKLRRHESFLLSWLEDAASGGGARNALWLSAGHPVHFRYCEGRVAQINKDWLRQLEVSSNGSRGLIALGEDGKPARLRSRG